MTLEEAIHWCVVHAVDINFGPRITIYEDFVSDLDSNVLGSGDTLIDAVQDAINKVCLPMHCHSIPQRMREVQP